ncbi:MAG: RNA polymerase epsilon subunit [Gemella sp.]|nr:RNA polymerase epsilon subunit [Gemella sp.]
MPVFKVFYQANNKEIPVRENTEVLYVEANNAPEVVKYAEDKNFNVEFVQELSEQHLEFEKESANFKLEKVNG